ncbi:hypothetical protein BKA61DRAFT_260945 [Leptodontidium sp. MPI-SDFR-AT-0119]|nr:hypothetical protein BKA61DRAFT_260945 [Leptodontidium sp. MPI-SDFR-AT-0119]
MPSKTPQRSKSTFLGIQFSQSFPQTKANEDIPTVNLAFESVTSVNPLARPHARTHGLTRAGPHCCPSLKDMKRNELLQLFQSFLRAKKYWLSFLWEKTLLFVSLCKSGISAHLFTLSSSPSLLLLRLLRLLLVVVFVVAAVACSLALSFVSILLVEEAIHHQLDPDDPSNTRTSHRINKERAGSPPSTTANCVVYLHSARKLVINQSIN